MFLQKEKKSVFYELPKIPLPKQYFAPVTKESIFSRKTIFTWSDIMIVVLVRAQFLSTEFKKMKIKVLNNKIKYELNRLDTNCKTIGIG